MSPKFRSEGCVKDVSLRFIGLQMAFKAKGLGEKLQIEN